MLGAFQALWILSQVSTLPLLQESIYRQNINESHGCILIKFYVQNRQQATSHSLLTLPQIYIKFWIYYSSRCSIQTLLHCLSSLVMHLKNIYYFIYYTSMSFILFSQGSFNFHFKNNFKIYNVCLEFFMQLFQFLFSIGLSSLSYSELYAPFRSINLFLIILNLLFIICMNINYFPLISSQPSRFLK